jgi:hypothetical protein
VGPVFGGRFDHRRMLTVELRGLCPRTPEIYRFGPIAWQPRRSAVLMVVLPESSGHLPARDPRFPAATQCCPFSVLLAQGAKCRGFGGWPSVISAASTGTVFRSRPRGGQECWRQGTGKCATEKRQYHAAPCPLTCRATISLYARAGGRSMCRFCIDGARTGR